MLKNFSGFLALCLLALFNLTGQARAETGIAACGNIHVEAEARCELVSPGIDCEVECTPLTVEAACAARLQVECDGQCSANATVDCAAECQAGCTGPCEVDPGEFDCSASCRAECQGGCQGQCEAEDNSARCEASCQAGCSAECEASCNVELPEIDCDRKCEASCEGSCRAEANVDCQVSCQNDSFASCEAEVTGGCEADCQGTEGALFCDGHYVDHDDNLQNCLDALSGLVEVEGYAEGEAGCEGNTCEASGKAGGSISCSALPGNPAESTSVTWMALLLLGLAYTARRRLSR